LLLLHLSSQSTYSVSLYGCNIINSPKEEQKVIIIDGNYKKLPINDFGKDSIVCIAPLET